MPKTLGQRFEARVDRTGDHHLWLGATKADGAGMIRVGDRMVTAHRVAWELVHGSLPNGARVFGCPEAPACVRIEHLRLGGGERSTSVARGGRARRGQGTAREIRPGVWQLGVSAGQYEDGSPRRLWRTVRARSRVQATKALAAFAAELDDVSAKPDRKVRDLTFDAAVERYLVEHLYEEKGREARTIDSYRQVHKNWFSPLAGGRRLADVDRATLDKLFGRMRAAGMSRSRMNQAKSLYGPLFRWARKRGIVTTNPMVDFELPTSRQVTRERVPPEVEEISVLLSEALVVIPETAPLLTLGAVTGMRRGELVGLRRSRIFWAEGRITVDEATDIGGRIKGTKTRRERSLHIDEDTLAMLRRHCDLMDERAAICGVTVGSDAFVFSDEPDCSRPWDPDTVTKRVGLLKEHLGIADKAPSTIALENEALRLYRLPRTERADGRQYMPPKGGIPFAEIGRRLGRSERWASLAVDSAQRREAAAARGLKLNFDGSILALRKFTSSELLDAGFNISMVAQRQGHGPQVLTKHYSKSRASADRKAAEHLGRVIHGNKKE